VREDSCQRIGHGGASALVRGNTLASFDAAQEIGVDMVEFDVRSWRGELVLAHTVLHARRGRNVRLGEALSHLASRRFADIGVNLDVKHVGCEGGAFGRPAALGSARPGAHLLTGPDRARPGCARSSPACGSVSPSILGSLV